MTVIDTDNVHVFGYVRSNEAERVIVLSNFSEQSQTIASPAHGPATELVTNRQVLLDSTVTLEPCQQLWLLIP